MRVFREFVTEQFSDHLKNVVNSEETQQTADLFQQCNNALQSFSIKKYPANATSGMSLHRDAVAVFGPAVYICNETRDGPLTIPRYSSFSTATANDLIVLGPYLGTLRSPLPETK